MDHLDTKQADKKSLTALCQQQKGWQHHPEEQKPVGQDTETLEEKEGDSRWNQYKKLCNTPNVEPDDT